MPTSLDCKAGQPCRTRCLAGGSRGCTSSALRVAAGTKRVNRNMYGCVRGCSGGWGPGADGGISSMPLGATPWGRCLRGVHASCPWSDRKIQRPNCRIPFMATIAECVTQPAIHHKLKMMPKASSSKVIELTIHAVAPTRPKPRSTGSMLQGTQDLARKAVGAIYFF